MLMPPGRGSLFIVEGRVVGGRVETGAFAHCRAEEARAGAHEHGLIKPWAGGGLPAQGPARGRRQGGLEGTNLTRVGGLHLAAVHALLTPRNLPHWDINRRQGTSAPGLTPQCTSTCRTHIVGSSKPTPMYEYSRMRLQYITTSQYYVRVLKRLTARNPVGSLSAHRPCQSSRPHAAVHVSSVKKRCTTSTYIVTVAAVPRYPSTQDIATFCPPFARCPCRSWVGPSHHIHDTSRLFGAWGPVP